MFTLPPLPYEYDALEPFIDTETMHLHHDKHHQAYIDNLNKALEGREDLVGKSIEELLQDVESIPPDLKQAVINNGGGHMNHSMFWEIMGPANLSGTPEGKLLDAIDSTFGDLEKFKEEFTAKALNLFGSGWVFLIQTPDGKLSIKRHSFQNNPISDGNKPVMGLDLWEHAYYLKYKNVRKDYVEAWWNVINWNKVETMFDSDYLSS